MFPNYACRIESMSEADKEEIDRLLTAELEAAGITAIKCPKSMRGMIGSETNSIILGELGPWGFQRFWYYWVAKGPGIPAEIALELHKRVGNSCRVAGHCGCPDPVEWYKGFACGDYHVDDPAGLKALADTIKDQLEKWKDHKPIKQN